MTTKTFYNCKSIVEKVDEDLITVTGYLIIDENDIECFYPQCTVIGLSGSTGRLAISDVQKDGETVTNIKQECFCMDDENREYCTFTTASE